MNVKIGRNDPCPCGSGKKYKKCCGAKETISITSIIEKEVLDLQAQILEYAFYYYETEIGEDFALKVDEIMTEDEQEIEFFMFIHSIWFTLFEPVANGKTILQIYIEDRSKLIQRPKLKEILQSWTKVRPIAGRVLSLSPEQMLVKDTYTKDILEIKLLESIDTSKEVFVFGMIVPFGEENIFFSTPFDLDAEKDEKEETFLNIMFEESGYDDAVEYLKDNFIELMSELPFAVIEYNPDDFEWQNPAHKEVANLFSQEMKNRNEPNSNIGMGVILWFKFCEKQPVQKKKHATYAAAVHYINATLNPLADVTKKEIADIYGVSTSSLTNAVREMEIELTDEIMELKTVVYEELLHKLELLDSELDDDEYWDEEDFDDDFFDLEENEDDELPDDIDDDDLPF